MTPFEKNLEFWRQLWRVIEKRSPITSARIDSLQTMSSSDVIVQIVDARNPLLFRCEDLENYVREMSPDGRKINVILVNKADLLTEEQRYTSIEIFFQYAFALIPSV